MSLSFKASIYRWHLYIEYFSDIYLLKSIAMSQCSLTFPPFKKLSVHEHYETKIDQEIVYLIISGVSNLLISGEESKQTEKIFKKSYC